MDYREAYEFWLNDDYFDQKTKEELKAIEGTPPPPRPSRTYPC